MLIPIPSPGGYIPTVRNSLKNPFRTPWAYERGTGVLLLKITLLSPLDKGKRHTLGMNCDRDLQTTTCCAYNLNYVPSTFRTGTSWHGCDRL